MADGAIDKLSIEIGASSTKAINSIKRIADSLAGLRDAMAGENGSTAKKLNDLASALHRIGSLGTISIGNKLPDQLKNLSSAVSSVTDDTIKKLDEMTSAIERLKGIDLRGFSNAVKAAKTASGQTTALATVGSQGMAKTGQLVPMNNYISDADLLRDAELFLAKQRTGSSGVGETAKAASTASKAFQYLRDYVANAAKEFQNMEKPAKKAGSSLKDLVAAFKRIAMYRFLRTVIKEITEAFTQGLEKAYLFSKSMSGEGNRFAAAMDRMKAATNQMKGQIGSAFISLLATIEPILTAIINLITRAADAISQFIAAFTGTTYLKAEQTAANFSDAMASGAKSAKEWKNQLMAFDVINRLEAPSDGSGGGGGSNPLAGFSMTDSPISQEILAIVQKIKDLINEIDFGPLLKAWDHLKEAVRGFASVVMDYLAAAWDKVLVPLAKWTIQEAAPRVVELLASAFELLTAVLERLKPVFSWIWDNVLEPIAKFVGDAFLKFLDTVIDLIKKLTDLISGKTTFKEFLKSLSPGQGILLALATAFIVVHGAISLFNGILTTVFLAVGALNTALSALISPIGLVILAIGALIAIGVALYQNWDTITAKFKQAGEELRGDWERTKEFFATTADGIKQAFSNLGSSISADFKSACADLCADIERAKAAIEAAIAKIKQGFENAKNAIINVFNGIRNAINNIINSIIQRIQSMINSIKNGLSGISSIGAVFGFSTPQFASGGFPEDGLFMANHGEMVGRFANGKTAVANNAEITAGIASAVYDAFMSAFSTTREESGGSKTIILNLNGREVARAIYDDQKAVARERGISLVAIA